jgi:hypothetical protein
MYSNRGIAHIKLIGKYIFESGLVVANLADRIDCQDGKQGFSSLSIAK